MRSLSPGQREAALAAFHGSLHTAIEPNTSIVEIHFQNQDPKLAADVANGVVEAYIERDLQTRFEGSQRVSHWLSGQLGQLKQQAEEAQKKLSAFQREKDIVPSDDSSGQSFLVDNLTVMNQQLAQAEADRIVKEAQFRMAQTRNPELLVSVAPDTVLSSLRGQQAQLLVARDQLESKFGPDYPRLKEVKQQLSLVQTDIDKAITGLAQRFEQEYQAALNTENLMRQRLDKAKQAAFQENESATQYGIMKHEATTASELYEVLQTRLEEAGITAGLSSNGIDVVDEAVPTSTPIEPKKRTLITIGLFGGILCGIALIIVRSSMDDTISTSEEGESVTRLSALGVIPHAAASKGAQEKTTAGATGGPDIPVAQLSLGVLRSPTSPFAEAFRTLRTNILLSTADRRPQVIIITSSLANEGKSTIASNLALALASRGDSVLLVDADLRRGHMHVRLGASSAVGLSQLITSNAEESAYQVPIKEVPTLTVISRGHHPPNPAELLSSAMFEQLVSQWRKTYDHIILDTPPVLPVADTLSILSLADVVIPIVRAGQTRRKALARTIEQLRRGRGHLAGYVINDVDSRLEYYSVYKKGYSYDYQTTED
jgi:capsular exopolysaccharide synthesis family protein